MDNDMAGKEFRFTVSQIYVSGYRVLLFEIIQLLCAFEYVGHKYFRLSQIFKTAQLVYTLIFIMDGAG